MKNTEIGAHSTSCELGICEHWLPVTVSNGRAGCLGFLKIYSQVLSSRL